MATPTDRTAPVSSAFASGAADPFRLTLESVTGFAAFTLDPSGRVVSWNAGAERVKGYKAEEIIGHHIACFYPPDDLAAGLHEVSLHQALTGGCHESEGHRLRKDGTPFWAGVTTTALFDHAGRHVGFVNVTRDITEKRRTESALTESEGRHRRLLDVMPEAVFIDTDGRIDYCNSAFAHLLGAAGREELVGRPALSIFHPNLHEVIRRRIETIQDHNRAVPLIEEEVVRLDGEVVPVEVAATAVTNPGRRSILVVLRDLRQRKEVERRFRALIDGVADYALYTMNTEGVIATWNDGAAQVFGFTAGEVLGQNRRLLFTAEDVAAGVPQDELDRAKAAGRASEERWRVRKDGSQFWANGLLTAVRDNHGTLQGFVKVIRDLTERKQAEVALRGSEQRYRTLFERAPIGIVYADDRSTYLDANECACAMLGYTRDELIGKNAADVVAPDEVEQIETALLETQGAAGHRREWGFRRRDGTKFVAEVVATQLSDGTNLGMICDVTELRAREREVARLSRLYAALSQVNQAIVRSANRDDLFRKVCRALVEDGGFRMAWIGQHDPHTHRLMPVATCGDPGGFVASIEVYADDRPEGRGPSGTAFRTGRPHVSNDILNDPATVPWREKRDRHKIRSAAAFPIRVGGAVCGTLSVYGGQPDIFHDKEIALLAEAATDISFALDNFERDEARRQAERAVSNEKHFSVTMIESMPGIVYFYDSALRFRRWNKNFEAVSGYAPEEIAGMHPLDFFAGEDRTLIGRKIAEVFAAGESAVEAAFVARDGTATPYYFTGRRVRFEGQDCLVGMGIDLSDRRRVESRLAESERKYRELVESANSIILRWNSAGRVTFLNEFGQRFFGYSADEIAGCHVIGTLVPFTESTGRDLRQLMDEVCAAPETFQQNVNECMKRNGERVWVAWTNRVVRDSEGRLDEILSVGSDITERKRAEASLREAELRYHTLFEQTPVGVVVLDPATAAVIESNEQAARQLGYTPQEFSRLGVADFEATLTPEDTRRRIEQVLGQGRNQFETRHRTKAGEVRDVYVSGQVIELAGRKVIHCVFLDITERKAAEAERELRQRAEAADRVKSAFLATMSHELRTPLNSIIGFTGVLSQGLAGPLNGEQRKQLDMVRTSARHLLALVNDVLDISKIEAGQLHVAYEPFPAKRSLEKVVALASPSATKKGVTVRLDVAPEVGVVVSDERRFEQILLNLLSNAVKFTDRGEVVVAADVVEGSQESAPSWLRVRVIDTGIGIRSDDLVTLFQPFRQIDSGLSRKYDGTGLGLAISARLAELMGGHVRAESQWGVGSTFTLTLPLTKGVI